MTEGTTIGVLLANRDRATFDMMATCRSLLALLFLFACSCACAQQHRLDSLLRVLKTQPTPDAARLRTLTAAAKTYATIDPKRAFALSVQAVSLARDLKDEKGLALAWVAQRWAYYYLGEYARADSLTHAIAAVAEGTRDPLLIGLNGIFMYSKEDPGDSAQFPIIKQRYEEAIAALRSIGDRALLAEGLFWYGTITWFHQDANDLQEALSLYRSLGDSNGVGLCVACMSNFAPFVNDPEGTVQRNENALKLFEQEGNTMWALWTRSTLTWYYLERTDYVRAVNNARTGLDAAERLGLPNEIAVMEAGLADVYNAIGDYRLAVDHHLRSLNRSAPLLDYRLNALNSIGRNYRLLGMPDSARYYLDRAIKENPYRGDNMRYAETRGYLAEVLAQQGETVRAAQLFSAALEVHRKYANNYMQEVYFSLGLGQLLARADAVQLDDLRLPLAKARAQAIELLEHTLELGGTHGMLKEQQDALHELSRLYEDEGQVNKAFAYQKRFLAMQDSVNNADKAKAVVRLESAYEEEQRTKALQAEQALKDAAAQEKIRTQKFLRNGLTVGVVLIALIAGLFFFQRNRISKEKAVSEEILYNVLPEEVANEIRRTGGAQSREIDQVSILFTDFKGFTELSARISRQELMDELNACFQAFDGIIGSHGIEKIKTIGDSYMAAAGLKGNAGEAAVNTVRAALRVQAFVEARKAERDQQGLPAFQMRVGIHTGPVVAGIVGVKKFQYDIWGDTVNTASRMESSGEVGQVNIGESTYALVKDEPGLAFTSRGKVQAKGKGEMEMYFVTRT